MEREDFRIKCHRGRRNIPPVETVRTAFKDPDEVIEGEKGRKVYHKLVNGKLLRVVEGDIVVTVYMTSDVLKYYRRGDEK